jgi:hypothetical protein
MSGNDWLELGFVIIVIFGAFSFAWFHHRKQSKGDHHARHDNS